jgi:hypothetical protein
MLISLPENIRGRLIGRHRHHRCRPCRRRHAADSARCDTVRAATGGADVETVLSSEEPRQVFLLSDPSAPAGAQQVRCSLKPLTSV